MPTYVAPTYINDNPPAINETNMNNLCKAVESLTVPNGGTGANSFTDGAILVGAGTDPIDELTGSGAVFATTNGEPQFGTLPVSCGGTGATKLQQLKTNLGLDNAGFVIQNTAPSVTTVLWIDTSNGTLKYYNGANWIPIVGTYGSAG